MLYIFLSSISLVVLMISITTTMFIITTPSITNNTFSSKWHFYLVSLCLTLFFGFCLVHFRIALAYLFVGFPLFLSLSWLVEQVHFTIQIYLILFKYYEACLMIEIISILLQILSMFTNLWYSYFKTIFIYKAVLFPFITLNLCLQIIYYNTQYTNSPFNKWLF